MVLSKFAKIRKIIIKKDYLHQRWTVRRTVIISALIIISFSFVLFFYFQQQSEKSIKNTIFEQQQKNQMDTTKAISENIKLNLLLIMTSLHGLADSKYLQTGDFLSNNTRTILENRYQEINKNTPIDRVFIVDKNGIARMNVVTKGLPTFVGANLSNRELVRQTKNTLSPVFSDGYFGVDGKYKIGIAYPIIGNNTKKEYIGLVGVVLPASEFFDDFGNIYNIKSQYLSVLDSKATHLAHPLISLIGLPFFGNKSQEIIGHNNVLNNLIKTVLISGKPSSGIYDFKNVERFTTGYPIMLTGSPKYSVFIITPTSTIYSKINDVIFTERLEMFSLIAGITASIMILIVFLIRWNSILDKEVKRRIEELEVTNNQIKSTNIKLETINDQLKIQDKMQKEFINIAAHELRTPIQPILGLSEIVKNNIKDKELKELLDIIIRNTKRLKNLAEDILDVARFESNTIYLNKEEFILDEVIRCLIKEFQDNMNINKKIKFEFNTTNDNPILVYADKNRISQVISNLVNNSIKFILNEGTISINIDKGKMYDNDINEKVVVKIKDTGIGIDDEILPNLFKKFTTKSFQGTGLGLYICKRIVEAHGGKIWAENNKIDTSGSILSFDLPLEK
ncbi:MAG: sensor histidine kinase [Thermoproteota archaeon]|nr:sensor histidine kinase [Thermoproteota archaeon]